MLSDKDRELIGIGASIAASCEPCAKFHLQAARIAGASDAEIGHAVDDALSVRDHATAVMERVAAEHGHERAADTTDDPASALLRELVSISAAHAVNSVADLEAHAAVARKLGATDGQIRSAIKIASAIKAAATGKVDRRQERLVSQSAGSDVEERSENRECHPHCGCQA